MFTRVFLRLAHTGKAQKKLKLYGGSLWKRPQFIIYVERKSSRIVYRLRPNGAMLPYRCAPVNCSGGILKCSGGIRRYGLTLRRECPIKVTVIKMM